MNILQGEQNNSQEQIFEKLENEEQKVQETKHSSHRFRQMRRMLSVKYFKSLKIREKMTPNNNTFGLYCSTCMTFAFLIALIISIYYGVKIKHQIKDLTYIKNHVIKLVPGNEGIQEALSNSSLNNHIIYLGNVQVKSTSFLEPDFKLEFENSASFHRITQFCQWNQQREHDSETDSVENLNEFEKAENIANNHLHFQDFQINEYDQSYDGESIILEDNLNSYQIGWKHRIVNSQKFSDQNGHHNPARNPFPNKKQYNHALIGQHSKQSKNLIINTHHLQIEDYKYQQINSTTKIIKEPGIAGYDRTDGLYIFSPYKSSPLFDKNKEKQYKNGSIYSGQQGVCTPGDLRTKWIIGKKYLRQIFIAVLPPKISLIALLSDNQLLPYKKILLNSPGYLSSEDLVMSKLSYNRKERQTSKWYLFFTFWGFSIFLVVSIYLWYVHKNAVIQDVLIEVDKTQINPQHIQQNIELVAKSFQ